MAMAGGLLGVPAQALAGSGPVLSRFAGTGAQGAVVPGPALSSPFNDIFGIGADADGNVLVTDGAGNHVDKITATGTLSIFAGTGLSGTPTPGPATSSKLGYTFAMAANPAGDVFVSDFDRSQIDRITADGTLSIVAGNGTDGTPVDGPALSTPLHRIKLSLGADTSGNVYFQDAPASGARNTIKKVTPSGTLSTIAGNGVAGMPVAGPARNSPLGVSIGGVPVDAAGNLYLADPDQYAVVKVTPSGTLSIVAGTGVAGPPTPGPAASSRIGQIRALAVEAAGNLFLADFSQNLIEKVTPSGTLSVYGGTGLSGAPVAGNPTSSPISTPYGLAVDGAGVMTVLTGYSMLRIGAPEPSAPRDLAATAGDASATLSFRVPSNPGTSALSGYEVSTDAGATWQALAATAGAGGTLSAALAGLTNGSTYSVVVRAVNGAGAGDPSAAVTLVLATPVAPKAAVRSISIVTRKAKLAAGKGRVTTVRLTCKGTQRCIGTLTVTKVIRVHGKRRTATLGRARYSIAGGHSKNIKVTLTKAARTLLGRAAHHTITARVNVKLDKATTRRNITITRAKAKATRKKA
jgi:hypothetical protein